MTRAARWVASRATSFKNFHPIAGHRKSPESPMLEPNLSATVTPWATQPLLTEVLPHLDPKYGGIATSVPRASLAAAAAGRHRSSLIAFCDPDEECPDI